ncbi:MAG: ArnT family glycosyltransferase [Acidithiobacillus ferrooxidans]|uniref:ArnT-like N-terminal domain-containing protein n=1 Tax=mine drainage metagenome TaxID=410659 RepID=E6QGB5_9ZZZZ
MTTTNTRNYWLLFALAAASFVFTFHNVQYTGEEAVYPLMSYEMWYHGHLLTPVMYGQDYWRPPLDNWLITMVSMWIGWSHMLVAARLIAALATVGSGLLVGWFAGRIWKERRLAAFAALVYITLGDVLFYDGWLAYSDPLFAFFCLAAMLLGWLAVMERRVGFFAIAVLALSCAFLTKALTVYVFYGVAVLVVTYRTRGWRFLFSWPSWGIHLLALVVPVLWYAMAPAGGTMAHGMFDDIIGKLQGQGLLDYLHQFFVFPAQTFGQLLPVGGVVLYALLRRYPISRMNDPQVRTALWIAGVNYLPYWLSPQSGIRYLMPLYGIVALVLAGWVVDAEKTRRLAVKWMMAAILLKYFFALWAFPAYTDRFRPHISAIARDVLMQTHGAPLYVTNAAWVGIGVTADIDLAIRPHPPLVTPPSNLANGFVISYPGAVPPGYTVVSRYQGVWLLCRGTVCGQKDRSHE